MATTLDKFFELGEHEKLVHHLAVKNYRQFLDGIRNDVPLDKLTDEDVKQFLSDFDYWRYEQGVKSLQEWLEKCFLNNSQSTLSVYPDSFPTWGVFGFKALLVRVYQRKQEHQMLLAAQKEREERAWLAKIEEQARQKQAEIEHDQYLDRLSAAVEKFRGELAMSKKPKFDYSLDLEKYEPDGWCELDLPGKQQIQNWAEGKIMERLPKILANLTKWELTWERRVLPRAAYEAAAVPCLTWYFESHILATVNLELKKCVIRKRCPGYTVEVQAEGEKLGAICLEGANWLTPGSLTTPVGLLRLLANGELEGPGITVTERNAPFTTFAVQGFEEEVELCDGFRKFIKDIAKHKPLAEALLDIGMADADTAKLVEAKWDEPLPVSSDSGGGGSELESVVTKLVEVGWTEDTAKNAVESTPFPPGASVEDKIKIILAKSYGDYV